MPIFRVKSVKIYTGQKNFTRAPLVGSWQISGMLGCRRLCIKKIVLVSIAYMECSISCTDRTCRVRSLQSETKFDWNEMIVVVREREILEPGRGAAACEAKQEPPLELQQSRRLSRASEYKRFDLENNASSRLPGFSGKKMQSRSNLSLASRSCTKIGKEPEKECSTGGWWRWPWPPCPAPPLFALWVRPTSSPSWQSERGSAQPQGMPIVPGCQLMIQ